jgi:hypothetical protein
MVNGLLFNPVEKCLIVSKDRLIHSGGGVPASVRIRPAPSRKTTKIRGRGNVCFRSSLHSAKISKSGATPQPDRVRERNSAVTCQVTQVERSKPIVGKLGEKFETYLTNSIAGASIPQFRGDANIFFVIFDAASSLRR